MECCIKYCCNRKERINLYNRLDINIMRLCIMNMAAAKDISGWKYEDPYSIYNMDGSYEGL